jgi:hypothetical protein
MRFSLRHMLCLLINRPPPGFARSLAERNATRKGTTNRLIRAESPAQHLIRVRSGSRHSTVPWARVTNRKLSQSYRTSRAVITVVRMVVLHHNMSDPGRTAKIPLCDRATTESCAHADHVSRKKTLGRGCKEWKERYEELVAPPEIVTRRSDSSMEKVEKDVPGARVSLDVSSCVEMACGQRHVMGEKSTGGPRWKAISHFGGMVVDVWSAGGSYNFDIFPLPLSLSIQARTRPPGCGHGEELGKGAGRPRESEKQRN